MDLADRSDVGHHYFLLYHLYLSPSLGQSEAQFVTTELSTMVFYRADVYALFPLFWLQATANHDYMAEWTFPQIPFWSSTMTLGSTVSIQWTTNLVAWFNTTPSVDPGKVDIYVRGWPQENYKSRLKAGISIENGIYATGFSWHVVVPDAFLNDTDHWYFEFVEAGQLPPNVSDTAQAIFSPGFTVVRDGNSSSSAAASAQTPVPATSQSFTSVVSAVTSANLPISRTDTATSWNSDASTSTQSTNQVPPQQSDVAAGADNIDKGLIAGAVAGSIAGAAALIWIGWLIVRRRKGRSNSSSESSSAQRQASDEFHRAFSLRKSALKVEQKPDAAVRDTATHMPSTLELETNLTCKPYRDDKTTSEAFTLYKDDEVVVAQDRRANLPQAIPVELSA